MSNETVILVNVLKPEPAKQAALIELLEKNTLEVVSSLKGWVSTRLIVSSDGASVIIYSEWATPDDIVAMRSDERMMAYFPRIRELASFESMQGHVVLSKVR